MSHKIAKGRNRPLKSKKHYRKSSRKNNSPSKAHEEVSSTIQVTAAHELTKEQIEHIQEIFGEDKQIKVTVDESLVGGVKIRSEDKLFDGTITSQLNRLKQHILN